jgi:hypothetical protein
VTLVAVAVLGLLLGRLLLLLPLALVLKVVMLLDSWQRRRHCLDDHSKGGARILRLLQLKMEVAVLLLLALVTSSSG